MHYCAVVFLLAFQASVPANGTSQTSKISGKLSREIDEQKMQIFLDELKICKERGEKMTAIITDNQTITITQNSSLHSVTNLTKSTTEFNITLKDVVISNSQCEGMVLDATLNYTEVGILLLCYKNDEIVEWNDLEKSNNSIMDFRTINFFNYIQELIYSLHPSDPDRNSNKLNIIRYHFIPNEIEQEEKEAEEENERLFEKVVIFLILIIAFICFIITVIIGIHWLCGRKKRVFNIQNEQMLLSPNTGRSGLLITETANDPYHGNKLCHINSKQAYHSIPYFE